jgi:hypothetical protein
MIYVSRSVNSMYLSFDSMVNLGILSGDFADSWEGAGRRMDRCHARFN